MILLSHARNNCVLVALIVNSLIINEMIWVLNKWRYPIPTYCDLDAFFPLQVSLMLLREYALSGCPEGCWSQSVILPALCNCRILQAYSLATGSHTPEPDVWVEVDPEIWVDPAWPRYKIQNKSVSSPFGVIKTVKRLESQLFKKIKGGKRMPKTLLGIPMPVKDWSMCDRYPRELIVDQQWYRPGETK